MILIKGEYMALSRKLPENAEYQLIDEDMQACLSIFFSVKAYSSFLSTSSHYSHVKV